MIFKLNPVEVEGAAEPTRWSPTSPFFFLQAQPKIMRQTLNDSVLLTYCRVIALRAVTAFWEAEAECNAKPAGDYTD